MKGIVRRSAPSFAAALLVLLLCGADPAREAGERPATAAEEPMLEPLGKRLPLFSVLPFAGLLLSIAILPLAAPHWWEPNRNKAKIAALFAIPLFAVLALRYGAAAVDPFADNAREYVSFIVLLASLFVVAGGIHIRGLPAGTPLGNTAVLALGALLANVIGTTGASMVLVRPMIRSNKGRPNIVHVLVFFIFIVGNCGGLLTPLGDPPLFLGYLDGVPFDWTLRLFPQWAFVIGALLVIFLMWDQLLFLREKRSRRDEPTRPAADRERFAIQGVRSTVILLGIVMIVFAAGRGVGNTGRPWPFGLREGLLLALTAGSYFLISHETRRANEFTFRPIVEVAVLFAGLFVVMTPALLILNAHAAEMGLREPRHYFWASGLISSILDNAPTYLAFAATACGVHGIPLEGRYLEQLLAGGPSGPAVLAAISCGCVFFGAITYIGNAPNFMVKATAEEMDVRMPGFLGYMIYSLSVLVPLFALATILFFPGGV